MEFKIEKGVPLPKKLSQNARYPFAEMEVGDSFFIPNAKRLMTAGSISQYCTKKTGKKFSSRREGNGIRVWRIS